MDASQQAPFRGGPVSPSRAWRAAIAFSFLLAAFAVGFLAFGEFGGWYYDGTGGYLTPQYDVDSDDYDMRYQRTGSEEWDSDGLFTEPALVFPILLAIVALGSAMVLLARISFLPTASVRRTLMFVGALASIAAITIAVEAVLYASSMEGDEWWFGSAFWAGLVNSVVLAATAFLLRAKTSGVPRETVPIR